MLLWTLLERLQSAAAQMKESSYIAENIFKKSIMLKTFIYKIPFQTLKIQDWQKYNVSLHIKEDSFNLLVVLLIYVNCVLIWSTLLSID